MSLPEDRPSSSLPLDEAAFRDLLDARGILKPDLLDPPPREKTWIVFSQERDVRLDVTRLQTQAARFFAAKIGLTVDKRYEGELPLVDAARVVLAASDAAGTRLCFGRRAEPADVAAVEAAEAATRSYGLAQLAQRCPIVWSIVPSIDHDRVALALAAIFASLFLGPIVSPGGEAFGVRTARMKLEARGAPYR